MNTRDEMQQRVADTCKMLRADKNHIRDYGLIESKSMAIGQVRRMLEVALEESMSNPYGPTPEWPAARLVLFNSIYR